jgi:CheY-like chemotaxis protein
LDLNIPGLDGRQLLEVIKSDPELKNIPVVVLTTSTHPSDVESCYRLGANSYHQKPSDFRRYEETIRQITEYWLQAVVSSLAASEAFGSAVPVGSG